MGRGKTRRKNALVGVERKKEWRRGHEAYPEEDNPGGVYDRETARMKTNDGLIGGKVYSYGCCG